MKKIMLVFLLFCFSLKAEPLFVPYLSKIEDELRPSNLENIDYLFLINLERRKDRLEKIKESFFPYNIGWNRVNAVEGKKLSNEAMCQLVGHKNARIRQAEMGCLLSHLSILWHSYKKKYQTIWVLEDDIEIIEDPKLVSSHICALNKLDPKWDIFYTDPDFEVLDEAIFNHTTRRAREDQGLYPKRYFFRRKIVNEFWKINRRWRTHSFVISNRGIEKIIKYYQTHFIWTAIDIDLHFVPDIRQYTPLIPLVTNQKESDSDTSH